MLSEEDVDTSRPPTLDVPTLIIRTDAKTVFTTIKPELLTDSKGDSPIRSLKVEIGPYGEPDRVTVELLPPSVLMHIDKPQLSFATGGEEIASIILRSGRRVDFPAERHNNPNGKEKRLLNSWEWTIYPRDDATVIVNAYDQNGWTCSEVVALADLPKYLARLLAEEGARP